MTPAARIQAAIEIVDEVIAACANNGAAADTIIKRYFKSRRYAGSKDRRAVREHVYAGVRRYGQAPASGRAALVGLTQDDPDLRAFFDGSVHGPAPLAANETGALPSEIAPWLAARFSGALDADDIASLAGRAGLDIRVNTMHCDRQQVASQFADSNPGALSDRALRLPSGTRVETSQAWQEGLIDIQDEGSQVIADACDMQSGELVVDLCAGAGGKTMALYDRVCGEGRFIACDTDRRRLAALAPRAARCRMPDIETRLLNPRQESERLADLAGQVDIVLVDAPCSGTGTWRRNPEARWRLTPDKIAAFCALQARILKTAADLVAPGGRLIYAVCSLVDDEGSAQIANFLEVRSDFRKVAQSNEVGIANGPGCLLTPGSHGTDGFFFARLERPC